MITMAWARARSFSSKNWWMDAHYDNDLHDVLCVFVCVLQSWLLSRYTLVHLSAR